MTIESFSPRRISEAGGEPVWGAGSGPREGEGVGAPVVVGGRPLQLGGAGVDRLVGAGEAVGAIAFGGQRLQLAQEPAVDQAALVDRLDVEPPREGGEDQVEALGAGNLESRQQLVVGLRDLRR